MAETEKYTAQPAGSGTASAAGDTAAAGQAAEVSGSQETGGRRMKRVADSVSESSHLLFPRDLNANGFLFGGRLLEWIDEMAGIVAKRHAECNVVTVAVDNMHFKEGAIQSDTIFMKGYLTWVGNSSMEVRIDTYAEKIHGTRVMINRAFFVMVGTDENQRPIRVPGLIVEGETQEFEYESGKRRQELRKLRAREGF